MDFFIWTCRCLLGSLLAFSGIMKVRSPLAARISIVSNYNLVPRFARKIVASSLPAIEIILGGMLLWGIAWEATTLSVALLLALFGVGMASNLVAGRITPCGCFGASSPIVNWTKVAINAGLACTAVVLNVHAGPATQQLSSSTEVALPTFAALAAIGVALTYGLAHAVVLLRRTRHNWLPARDDHVH